jgi:hypothetical protein
MGVIGPFSGFNVGLASRVFIIHDGNSFHPDWMPADGTKRVHLQTSLLRCSLCSLSSEEHPWRGFHHFSTSSTILIFLPGYHFTAISQDIWDETDCALRTWSDQALANLAVMDCP